MDAWNTENFILNYHITSTHKRFELVPSRFRFFRERPFETECKPITLQLLCVCACDILKCWNTPMDSQTRRLAFLDPTTYLLGLSGKFFTEITHLNIISIVLVSLCPYRMVNMNVLLCQPRQPRSIKKSHPSSTVIKEIYHYFDLNVRLLWSSYPTFWKSNLAVEIELTNAVNAME